MWFVCFAEMLLTVFDGTATQKNRMQCISDFLVTVFPLNYKWANLKIAQKQEPLRLANARHLPWRLNLTHKISNEIDTVEDKKQLNEPLPNDL